MSDILSWLSTVNIVCLACMSIEWNEIAVSSFAPVWLGLLWNIRQFLKKTAEYFSFCFIHLCKGFGVFKTRIAEIAKWLKLLRFQRWRTRTIWVFFRTVHEVVTVLYACDAILDRPGAFCLDLMCSVFLTREVVSILWHSFADETLAIFCLLQVCL